MMPLTGYIGSALPMNSHPPFQVLYEDAHILAVGKAADISFLPGRSGGPSLLRLVQETHPGARPVHRLDKGTSGVVLFARSRACQVSLNRQFSRHSLKKFYTALVKGSPIPAAGVIDLPIVKGRKNSYRIAAERATIEVARPNHHGNWHLPPGTSLLKGGGLDSLTRFRTVASRGGISLLSLMPRTGRTHQLRVHLSWIGFPILGDERYGKSLSEEERSGRLALHARRICWLDDYTGTGVPTWRTIVASLPSDWPSWRHPA